MVTSTPEGSIEALQDSDISIIPSQLPHPIIVSDSSTADLDLILETCISHQQLCTRECDVHDQPTMRLETSDQSLTPQTGNEERNNKNKSMDLSLEQLEKEKIKLNLESLDDLGRSGNKSATSKRKRNKSLTSDDQPVLCDDKTTMDQSTERNNKNKSMDLSLEQLQKEKIRRNLESLNNLDRSGNKSATSERKRHKSITSDDQPALCGNKISMSSMNKSITSQVENWLRTTNIDACTQSIKNCLCWQKSVQVQIPQEVHKSTDIVSSPAHKCDCKDIKDSAVRKIEKAQKIVKIEEEMPQQSQRCDCGNDKDSAGVQETQKSVKIEENKTSLLSQVCDCNVAKGSTRVQNSEQAHSSVKVEEQILPIDAEQNLKPCPCVKLECMKKDETGIQASEEKAEERTSDDKDSGGGSSCAGACEQYYRNKLMSTLQILENKEETIRVQGSSLGVAEARIAALTERACALRCELDQKARELNKLRKFAESCRVEKADISITAEMQEVETQKHIVNTLQDNLSVIAELYRECFFETAKQEELVDMLRKSYLDVRLMDKDKADRINRLQNVINTQKWSIEQCQDVVVEVENLKSEISNFLNSSNNDSGMWERGSESPDVGEELGDILDQLRQLQDMLTGDCTCGLEEENKTLRKKNEHLEVQVEKLRHRVSELEGTVLSSHSLGQQYQKQIEEKEQEFHEVRQKLIEFESANKERGATCETLSRQLQQSQVLLDDKIVELAEAQRARSTQESAVTALRQELDQADAVIKEGLRKLMEASQWRTQLDESQARVEELERQLQTVCAQCRDLEMCCREKERAASVLQGQLEEAHTRGAALCDESRRVTACVRQWMRRQRALAREQQEKIRTQESMLNELQRCVEARQNHSVRTSQSEMEPRCSKSSPRLHPCASGTTYTCSRPHLSVGGSETAFSSCLPIPCTVERESEMPSCSKCSSNRQDRRERSSESEMASCSSAPVPPRRRKKLPPCGDSHCPWSPNPHIRFASLPRQISPTDEIIEHVEHLHAALAATQRRWARPRR